MTASYLILLSPEFLEDVIVFWHLLSPIVIDEVSAFKLVAGFFAGNQYF